jgi:DNA-binding NtrC family response regulator
MTDETILSGKRVLIVDDEADILETLTDLLPMCEVHKASSFHEAQVLLESRVFDLAILDIMGVAGYDLLEMATAKKIIAVMLTARAIGPNSVQKAYTRGAAYYIPKEEMVNIETCLIDILKAAEKGESTWGGWLTRMAAYCERTFKPDWQKGDEIFWDRFPFY